MPPKKIPANRSRRDPSPFDLSCYDILCQVPPGKITTYALIAKALGSRGARAVGNAMNRNPFAPKVPCHRVVRSDGSIGGYAFGTSKKCSLLRSEGVKVENQKVVDLDAALFRPKAQRATRRRPRKGR